jgi:hypothetical protein
VEENYKSFHQEEGIIVIQDIIDNLFEEDSVSESPRSMRRTRHRQGGMTLFSSVA